ncbi:MAG TPA: alcohol dehydrogenase catalytic domain-containing protein [Blastocatellia bacterium]|nr:alcohol dehydrogenase catalytic domain-containing protein [Blastocatellia bacterium]
MKTALFYGGRDIRVEQSPIPKPGDGQVLVAVRAAGICGSDLHFYRGASIWDDTPHLPHRRGHELAGVIAELGSGANGYAVGQRVGIEPAHLIGCGHCQECIEGQYHICSLRDKDGNRLRSGGFAEFDLAAMSNIFPLPDNVSFEAASMIDVYACGVHALNRTPVCDGSSVAIVGAGPLGMALGQIARASGAGPVIMVGRRDQALAAAARAGAADMVINRPSPSETALAVQKITSGRGASVVFETAGGDGETLATAIAIAAPGASIGLLGCFEGSTPVKYSVAASKELSIIWLNGYSTWRGKREYLTALDLLSDGKVSAERLISHRFPLGDLPEAFATAADKVSSRAIKVVVEPQGE